MRTLLLLAVLSAVSYAAAPTPDDSAKGSLKELEGNYKMEALTKNGTDVPEEARKNAVITFSGDMMSLRLPDKAVSAKIKIDTAKSPHWIDISPADGTEKGKSFPGIYKLEKDELTIAFSERGERPTEFKGDGEVALMKLKKEEKEKK